MSTRVKGINWNVFCLLLVPCAHLCADGRHAFNQWAQRLEWSTRMSSLCFLFCANYQTASDVLQELALPRCYSYRCKLSEWNLVLKKFVLKRLFHLISNLEGSTTVWMHMTPLNVPAGQTHTAGVFVVWYGVHRPREVGHSLHGGKNSFSKFEVI